MDEELPVTPTTPPDVRLSDVTEEDVSFVEPTAPTENEVGEVWVPAEVASYDARTERVASQLETVRIDDPLIGAVGGDENAPPQETVEVAVVKKQGKTSGRTRNQSEYKPTSYSLLT